MKTMNKGNTKWLTTVAMLCAVAYVAMVVGRVPIVWILKYDPKDVIITIGGFLYGPMTAVFISAVVSAVEMLTVSDTGVIGCVMNIISSCFFAGTASFIYKKKHTVGGATVGLAAGVLSSTAIMLLWNYLMVPIYSDIARADVAKMLVPTFLPFNLLKGGINMSIILLLYKPIVNALRKAGLVPPSDAHKKNASRSSIIFMALFLLTTCVFFVLVIKGLT